MDGNMKADTSSLEVEYVEPTRLSTHPRNPRQGDVGAIYTSIKQHGVYTPVVAQRSTGHILVGNHRFRAMLDAGLTKIPVIWRDVDDETGLKIMLADNRASDLATNDDEALLALLQALPDLDGTLYDGDDLDDLAMLLEGQARSLDDLAAEYGDFSEDDTMKTITLRVPPALFDQWVEHRRAWETDAEALEAVLDR